MATRIFIDGYNLLWAADTHRPGNAIRNFEGSRDALIERLAEHTGLAKHQVTLIFDAHKTDAACESSERRGNITVMFTRQGKTADAVIRELCQQYRHGAIVVSSDREVARYAEKKGCGVLGSHEFNRLIDDPNFNDWDEDDEDNYPEPKKGGPARREPKARRRALQRLR